MNVLITPKQFIRAWIRFEVASVKVVKIGILRWIIVVSTRSRSQDWIEIGAISIGRSYQIVILDFMHVILNTKDQTCHKFLKY